MKQTKRLPKPQQETKLERVVRYWLNSRAADYENGWRGVYKDLAYGGCESGMVSKLIYYTDTVKFYKRHRIEIQGLLMDAKRETGQFEWQLFGDKWDVNDPQAREYLNQNLLAWFAFEETARRIADANGYDN